MFGLDDLKGWTLFTRLKNQLRREGKCDDAQEGATRPEINKEYRDKYIAERGGKDKKE